jgi:16S rRNA (cytosine1402-N4)-methyltransferase
MQLDNPDRGFTFKEDGPLDLRLNPHRGQPASEKVRSCSKEMLESLLRENADEPYAREIAAGLFEARKDLSGTRRLAEVISITLANRRRPVPPDQVQKSITRTFQALRIAVNDEFEVLDLFLSLVPDCLRTGGRVAILSFHSGEDRRVKKAFRDGLALGLYSHIADTPQRPSRQEIYDNPRSASAKLRWAVRS